MDKLKHKYLSVNSPDVAAFGGFAAGAQAWLDKLNGVKDPIKRAPAQDYRGSRQGGGERPARVEAKAR